ncbi:MAG: hypothetical protein H7A01_14420 [Hahellaceae bacterium]|nr:hypothetical protein [Hahellaceae bacterium]MCP5210252.1 hypothetical protein [Hahellaceae bacterium]
MAKANFILTFRDTATRRLAGIDTQFFECRSYHNGNPDSLCVFEDHRYKVTIWGDAAQASQNTQMINDIIIQSAHSYWGRSWVCFDKQERVLTAATDKLGLFPIHSYITDDFCILASSRKELISCLPQKPRVNPQAMLQMLCFSQVLDSSSIFAGVDHHEGGTKILVSANGELSVQVNRENALFTGEVTDFDDALDAFVAAVKSSLDHSPEAIISLSGGLDSRLILAAALSCGYKVTGLSYGSEGSSDIVIARALAAAAKIPLFTSRSRENQCKWQASKRIAEHGMGEVALHHGHALIDEDLITQTMRRSVITGTGAETYRAFYYDRGMPGFSLFGYKALTDRFLPHAKRYIREEFGKTATPLKNALPGHAAQINSWLENVLTQHENNQLSAASYLDNFYLKVRVPRMVAAGQQLLDDFYDRSHPFLDQNVVHYAGNLPAHMKLGSTFHRKAIEKLSPKLASITWDKTSQPLKSGISIRARYPGLASRLGMAPAWGKQSGAIFNYSAWLQAQDTSIVGKVLQTVGVEATSATQAVNILMSSPVATHVQGFATIWSYFLTESTNAAQPVNNIGALA